MSNPYINIVVLKKMRASSQLGDPQAKIREIAFEMEMASIGKDGEEGGGDDAANDNSLNEGVVFERGSNRMTTTVVEDRLLSGG